MAIVFAEPQMNAEVVAAGKQVGFAFRQGIAFLRCTRLAGSTAPDQYVHAERPSIACDELPDPPKAPDSKRLTTQQRT